MLEWKVSRAVHFSSCAVRKATHSVACAIQGGGRAMTMNTELPIICIKLLESSYFASWNHVQYILTTRLKINRKGVFRDCVCGWACTELYHRYCDSTVLDATMVNRRSTTSYAWIRVSLVRTSSWHCAHRAVS